MYEGQEKHSGLYSETLSEDEEEGTQGNRSSPFKNANQI